MTSRPAAGGGRWVSVDPERLTRWFAGFADRHGEPAATVDGAALLLTAPDGAVAECHPPPGVPAAGDVAGFVAAALVPRRVGLLLARRAAVAVGVAHGTDLLTHKVDSSYVQSRTAAGGWSQQRFARRRGNQAQAAAGSAADIAARLLLPERDRLAALVTGGDRRAVAAVLADRRLAPLEPLRAERFLDVPDPRLAVLQKAAALTRQVPIRVREPVV
ncbi:acVLRF1 family peptidyl-tRNA hydrolase [Rhizomonospora bruguierae]|uniref:acVLRF1 family peptidyl-tRNA hydrolase n=1 Tax=Rhizomonospora bruguierae TaxID=1581705 RepID=UPI0024BEE19E|nr:acVLRF1 family peptidyl-tRNA hydrolase [Micromonospora sp. NBRC 107566]